jgi:hypothetical protein
MIHPNELLQDFYSIEEFLSLLTTFAESSVKWHSVPSSETLIIKERLDTIKASIGDLFERLENYDN